MGILNKCLNSPIFMELLYVLFMHFNMPMPILGHFVFNCILAIQKALEARGSSLNHFGSRFDHFRRFFRLMRAPICLRIEDRAHSSKKIKEAATQHSMWVWRAYGPRDGHVPNMWAHDACLPWPKSHAASMVAVWLSRLH